MLTSHQIRAARALLRWTAAELAAKSGVSYHAIQRAENADGIPNMHTRNLMAVKSALEAAGITFLDGVNDPAGQGVRLRPISR